MVARVLLRGNTAGDGPSHCLRQSPEGCGADGAALQGPETESLWTQRSIKAGRPPPLTREQK